MGSDVIDPDSCLDTPDEVSILNDTRPAVIPTVPGPRTLASTLISLPVFSVRGTTVRGFGLIRTGTKGFSSVGLEIRGALAVAVDAGLGACPVVVTVWEATTLSPTSFLAETVMVEREPGVNPVRVHEVSVALPKSHG